MCPYHFDHGVYAGHCYSTACALVSAPGTADGGTPYLFFRACLFDFAYFEGHGHFIGSCTCYWGTPVSH
eukprot:12661804-Alexandrium_andersonii.AAC.1